MCDAEADLRKKTNNAKRSFRRFEQRPKIHDYRIVKNGRKRFV